MASVIGRGTTVRISLGDGKEYVLNCSSWNLEVRHKVIDVTPAFSPHPELLSNGMSFTLEGRLSPEGVALQDVPKAEGVKAPPEAEGKKGRPRRRVLV